MMDLTEEGKNYYLKESKAYTEDDVLVNNLFVYNLPRNVRESEIVKYFQNFGKIQKVNLISDKKVKTRRSAPPKTGFICFEDPLAAANVLQKSSHFIRSKRISVKAGDTWHQPGAIQIVSSASESKKEAVVSGEQNDDNVNVADNVDENNGTVKIQKRMLELNDDCLEIICKKLEFRDQVRFAQVCERFQSVFKLCSKLQFKVFNTENLMPLTLWEIRNFFQLAGSNIETISGTLPYKNRVRVVEIISQFCPSVTHIHFDSTKLKANCLRKFLERSTNVTELALVDCSLNDNAILTLQKLPRLKSLTLSKNCELTGKHLHKLKTIEDLNLFACVNLQSSYFGHIFKSLTELKTLNIMRCERFTATIYSDMIKHCEKLENLKISNIADLPYENVARLPNLVHLVLVSTSAACAMRQQFFNALAEHKSEKLQYLKIISKHCMTYERAGQIAKLKQLKSLICPNNEKLDDNCLRHFSELENLEELVIRNCDLITNAGLLTLLRGCKHLQQLNVQMCPNITDAFIFDAIKILNDPTHKEYRKEPLICFVSNTLINSYIVNDAKYIAAERVLKINIDSPYKGGFLNKEQLYLLLEEGDVDDSDDDDFDFDNDYDLDDEDEADFLHDFLYNDSDYDDEDYEPCDVFGIYDPYEREMFWL